MVERSRDTTETVHHHERLFVSTPVDVVDAQAVDVKESVDRLAVSLPNTGHADCAERHGRRHCGPQRFHGDQIILTHMAETVEFRSNGNTASGYLAKPATGSGPGVLVIQEWWGLDAGIKEMADRLAQAGFVALAPDLYHGEVAGHDEMDKASHLMQSLPPDRAGRDMSGAVDYLATHPSVTSKGIGVVGFCMGGMLAFIIAANRGDKVTAVVPFYGFPQGPAEPDWSKLTAAVSGHMAENDSFFSPQAAHALEAKLRGMGKRVTLTVHPGTGHAFMGPHNALGTFNADVAAKVWPQAISFLKDNVK